ncbi:hypothetical protein HOP50_03g23870 [Chloropicon primus]|uniref:Uncharacterized protein n=1 Tax=Chloropicon primus TaxID=1764295 RepID=A0A5B8MKG0_9CHLO|nr:hypothetical protein A3770_03p23880 [Chloropicon primus]UPQ99081.1 hypothetical protein HOP50_03g23870 [Chloropicon primus]|eukprot:QDZ19870.1 hypothetical protein A3770_03p23880 [Chloropicon primus]
MSAASLIAYMNENGGSGNSAAASMAFEEWVDEHVSQIFWNTSEVKSIFEYFNNDAVMHQCLEYLAEKFEEMATASLTCQAVAAILSNTKNESVNYMMCEKLLPLIRDKQNKQIVLDCFSNRAVQMQVEDLF